MFETIIPHILAQERQQRTLSLKPLHARTGTLTFVDGGNAPIYTSPRARIELVRIARVTSDGKRLTHDVREGILLLLRDRSVHVISSSLGIDQVLETASLEEAANWCRFILECDCDELIIRDGPLLGQSSAEHEALTKVRGAGLSKTSERMHALPDAPGTWLAPLGEERNVTISIVKLHARADYHFRLDTWSDPTPLAEQLVAHSADPAFLGYPYPLVVADRLARINPIEIRTLRARLEAEAGPAWEQLRSRERYTDAHALLDVLNRKI